MVGRFHDSDSDSEESDRIIPQNSMFGTRENFHDDQEEDEEQDSTGFESSYDSENTIKVRFISYSKCSNLRRISKLSSDFGCLFTFCCLNGANSTKTGLHTVFLHIRPSL